MTQESLVVALPTCHPLGRTRSLLVVLAMVVLATLTALSACSGPGQSLGPSEKLPEAQLFSSLAYLEPAGMKLLASNDWTGFSTTVPRAGGTYSGWYRYQSGNYGRTLTDASAGCGSSSVLEVTIPKGFPQGSGPEHLAVGTTSNWLPTQGTFSQLYVRYCVWVPANYYGSTSGVQKLFHLSGTSDASATGASQAVPSLVGVGTAPLYHQLRLQNMSTKNGGVISFNLSCAAAARGRWDRVEVLLTQNSGGLANGTAKMWVNGTQCMQRTNLTWSGATRTSKRWTAVQLNPTYGGSGTVTTTQYLRYGSVRVSAK